MEISSDFFPHGVLGAAQISNLYKSMFSVSVSDNAVASALDSVCGKGTKAALRSQLVAVLQHVHDYKSLYFCYIWIVRLQA